MIRTGPASGLNSDFVTSSMYIGDSLPEGLRLGEYEIQSVIGEGGFGIVYLAYDHFLQRQVALKEYMPSSLAGRSRMGLDVTIKSERHRDTFQAGLKSFINEARLLAQFDHRALVKVYRFWEGNGTAYMVMPYVIGPTLKAALAEMPGPPDEAWLRGQVLAPLMEALGLLHKASCLHRDIAPDNILLTETGPMLLDFGAARKVIGDLNQTLTVVLKPGYAPIEQYGEVAALTQGPWTDVYALGGVVRYAITGKVPVSATTRLVQDTMVPLAQLAAGQYSEGFLRAVDATLAVKPADRPQDMASLAALLEDGGTPLLATPGVQAATSGWVRDTGEAPRPTVWPQPVAPSGAAAPVTQPRTQAPVADAGMPQAEAPVAPRPAVVAEASQAQVAKAAGSAVRWAVAAGAGVLVLGVAAWFVFKPTASDGTRAAASSVAPSTPFPASAVNPAPVPSPAAPPSTGPVPRTPTAAPAAPPAAEQAPVAPAPVVTAPPLAPSPQAPTAIAAPKPAPVRANVPVEAVHSRPADTSPAPRAAAGGDKATRCSDLLQKASLEPLTPGETSFLKTECK